MAESVVACTVLTQMTELGRPESYSNWSVTCLWVGIVDAQFQVMHQRRNALPECKHHYGWWLACIEVVAAGFRQRLS